MRFAPGQQLDSGAVKLVERADLNYGSRPRASSSEPARNFVCAATSACWARRIGAGVSTAARSRKAAAAAKPPRACARVLGGSLDSPARSSSGTDAAGRGATCGDPGRSADRLRRQACVSLVLARSAWPLRTLPSARADAGTSLHRPPSANPPTRGRARPSLASELPRGMPQKGRVADGSAAARSSSRRVSRELRASRRVEAVLDLSGERQRRRQPEASGELSGGQSAGSSRSASGFPPVSAMIRSRTDSSRRGTGQDRLQQGPHPDGPADQRGRAAGSGPIHFPRHASRMRARSSRPAGGEPRT